MYLCDYAEIQFLNSMKKNNQEIFLNQISFFHRIIRAVARLGQAGRHPGKKNFSEIIFVWKSFVRDFTNESWRFIWAFRKYKHILYVTYIDYVLFLFRFFKGWIWNFRLKRAPQKTSPQGPRDHRYGPAYSNTPIFYILM